MTQEEYREELLSKISRASEIVDGLSKSKAFSDMIEDVTAQTDRLDKSWHLIPEDDKWQSRLRELRTSKLASTYIINILKTYECDILRMRTELDKLDNPQENIVKDFDTN